jgi:phosphopantetheinyl transferase
MPVIHLVLMDAAAAPAEAELLPRLHPEEQARYHGFTHADRRLSWRAGRGLLLAALAQVSGPVDATALRTAESGGVCYGEGTLHLSVSHSGGLIGAALAAVPVGLDLEWPRARLAVDQGGRVYTDAEAAQLQALPPAERQDAFYALWTLKEAACKAMGFKLWQGLRYARFDLDTGRFFPEAPFPGGPWACLHARLAGGARVALAVRDPGPVELECLRYTGPQAWDEETLVQPAWVYAR